MTPPRVMTIAGSDSGGGAGIQADIKTLTSLHVYATSAITSVTAQNTKGVTGIHDMPPEFVSQQISAILSDIGTDAIKIGMLSSVHIVKEVASVLKKFPEHSKQIVVDPVMVATSGSRLLAAEATEALIKDILPMTYILTPNVPEAEVLLGMSPGTIKSTEDMHTCAKKIAAMGPKFVLLKGGHLPLKVDGDKLQVIDIVYNSMNESYHEIPSDYIQTKNTHGTGCTLSAALAGELAKGAQVEQACENAIHYVKMAISQGLGDMGQGNGPINHFHPLRWSPYNGKPLIQAIKDRMPEGVWSDFIDHPFVRGIADGTLPLESFTYYLKQDYLYLQHYARAASLAAYKCGTMDAIKRNAAVVMHITEESENHIKYCARYGISREDILSTPESVFNSAYTRFVLDKGAAGDILDLKMAMAPCLIGYGDIGLKLYNDPATKREGNPYWEWICQYAADDYQNAEHGASPARYNELCKTFEQATRLEIMFWENGITSVLSKIHEISH
ncbi:Phosphomethylpyrimidine kinase-domain-containing protein [Mycotypha africana]|uniref:Phosphomethylpyrimidine kinase-domain-containing protein n=1 Tax=Mycotypha africana TaxID=64632 RepID=UPI002300731C|nr:Phosphomethylpyrimidine kinase-domain-containing protein [Mycotypha africana]KAI8982028.1 Phosphomethylpyrimidine kinase-domain-containing protein [Mycotypha africana]